MGTTNNYNAEGTTSWVGINGALLLGVAAVAVFIMSLYLNLTGVINGLDFMALGVLSVGLAIGGMMLRTTLRKEEGPGTLN